MTFGLKDTIPGISRLLGDVDDDFVMYPFFVQVAGEGWFGGGADLTPYYLNDGDVEEFHRFYKDICDRYDVKVSFVFVRACLDCLLVARLVLL